MSMRDKDNREKKSDTASHITNNSNNVKEEIINVNIPKRKSMETDNEMVSVLGNNEDSSLKSGALTMEEEDDIESQLEENSGSVPIPKRKRVNIDTSKNTTIPSYSNASPPPSNTSTDSNARKTTITTNNNIVTIDAKDSNNDQPAPHTTTPNTPPPSSSTTTKPALPAGSNTQQQDKMQKLAFLTDLYDQGYITVVEYKERKSQIIDELTGTRTRTRNNSHVIIAPPTVVASPPPDWSTIREEAALRHVFDTTKNQWSTTVVKVKLDKEPFACGGLRKCYHMHDCTRPEDKYVAKLSIDPFEDHEIYFIDVEMQMHSKEFARKFNQYNPPKNVDFVMAWLLELIEREGRPLCGVETFIEGPYRKHNNNFGYVSEDERNTPQAFSHFTYEASNHKILICDIQGVADLYTDPQMHTIDNKKAALMGKGNMGVRGISKFLATHQCNAICRYLRLPSINAKLIDAGTVPATTYMSYQKVDVVNIECYHPSPHMFGKDDSTPLIEPSSPPPPVRRACTCAIL